MKKLICALIISVLISTNVISAQATVQDKGKIIEYLDDISRNELATVTNPSYGSMGGEWLVMALARYGTISDKFAATYKKNLEKKLESSDGILSTRKYTEYARVVIALTAIEENPANFKGYNLLKPLAELDNVTAQGANGILYTLIALDSGNYKIPEPKSGYTGAKTTREKLVNIVLEKQLDDGGWSMMGTKSDADMTAIAIQALKPYYSEKNVKDAINNGLNRLGKMQQDDGDYGTSGRANCESTAQVLTALSVMNVNIKDSRFNKNGKSIIDGLMKYYKKGGFCHFEDGDINQMSTEQGMYALVAYFRSLSEMNSLYDMKDGMTKRTLVEINNPADENDNKYSNENQKNNDKKSNLNKNSNNNVANKEKDSGNKVAGDSLENKKNNGDANSKNEGDGKDSKVNDNAEDDSQNVDSKSEQDISNLENNSEMEKSEWEAGLEKTGLDDGVADDENSVKSSGINEKDYDSGNQHVIIYVVVGMTLIVLCLAAGSVIYKKRLLNKIDN